MKFCIILLFACLAVCSAAISQIHRGNTYQKNTFNTKPQAKQQYVSSSNGKDDKVLRNEMEMNKDGSYNYQYETSNGISGKENGVGGVSVQGSSSYISPEGIEIKTSYVADETGYHPVGDHIPKIPDYILRALEYIRTHPQKEEDDYKKANVRNNAFVKKASITTNIAPPTYKPVSRKVTPTTKRSNAFKNQNQKGKRF